MANIAIGVSAAIASCGTYWPKNTLQLLDAVDHRLHDAAGALAGEPGRAELRDLVVELAAQLLLHAAAVRCATMVRSCSRNARMSTMAATATVGQISAAAGAPRYTSAMSKPRNTNRETPTTAANSPISTVATMRHRIPRVSCQRRRSKYKGPSSAL